MSKKKNTFYLSVKIFNGIFYMNFIKKYKQTFLKTNNDIFSTVGVFPNGRCKNYSPNLTFHKITLQSNVFKYRSSNKFYLNKFKIKSAMLTLASNKLYISCIKSRIETNRCFYGCFYLGPFDPGQSLTVANALRRTLLSELKGIAITSVEIEGALHEYSNLPGVRDSVLDILLNLKEIVLKKKKYLRFFKTQIGYLRAQGPGVITAADLQLPPFIQCIDPEQYIATLSDDGLLNMKFCINEGKNYNIQTYNNRLNGQNQPITDQSEARQNTLNKPATFNQNSLTGVKISNTSLNYLRKQSFWCRRAYYKSLLRNKHRSLSAFGAFVKFPRKFYSFWSRGSQSNPELFGSSPFSYRKGIVKILTNQLKFTNTTTGKSVQEKVNKPSSNPLLIDPVFMPILKVNYIIESHELANDLLDGTNNVFYKPEESFISNVGQKKEVLKDKLPVETTLISKSNRRVVNSLSIIKNKQESSKIYGQKSREEHLVEKKKSFLSESSQILDVADLKKTNLRKKSKIVFLGNILGSPKGALNDPNQGVGQLQKGKNILTEAKQNLKLKKPSKVKKKESLTNAETRIAPNQGLGQTLQTNQSISTLDSSTRLLNNTSDNLQSNLFGIENIKTAQTKIDRKHNVRLEIWTNGSIHPREALYKGLKNLLNVFGRLKKVKYMGSMYKSEKSYKTYFNGKTIRTKLP